MAYENMTYPELVRRLEAHIQEDYPELDYREGSIVFNSIAAAAMELAIAYVELNNVQNESFVQTASREYILMGCRQAGMDTSQFEASAGIHKAVFNVPVKIGSRWNLDVYNFTVLEQMPDEDLYSGMYIYKMRCETVGSEPNGLSGVLTPIDLAPENLTYSMLVGILILGEDEASEEEMRKIYQDFVDDSISDGNKAQYIQWANEFNGIGNAKVFSLWNGDNTVKVSILDTGNNVATHELITSFQEYLDPGSTGMGDGVAPIGAIVTVTTATEKTINVACKITFVEGYSDTTTLDTALEEYFRSLSYTRNTVSYMGVGAMLMSVEGVDFITELTLNGSAQDITLGDEEIPKVGTTDWTVV